MSMTYAQASRLASNSPKDFDFQFFIYQKESDYPFWWSSKRAKNYFHSLPDNTVWNCIMCLATLASIVLLSLDIGSIYPTHTHIASTSLNVLYAVHAASIWYNDYILRAIVPITWSKKLEYVMDVFSFSHYILMVMESAGIIKREIFIFLKYVCYYIRLHRPFKYLWALNDYNLKGSVVGTALKFTYIFLVMRVTYALLWLNIDKWGTRQLILEDVVGSTNNSMAELNKLGNTEPARFFRAFYLINKMFIPIGPQVPPANDMERMACLLIMLSGCLGMTGIAIASLALVISLYIRPEEVYRSRVRLIKTDMETNHVPKELSEKVETFYRMYWLKQKGVSESELLTTFPPTLPASVYTDIYFEAQQKSYFLSDLTYQFLSEIAKTMKTFHFIPGDSIIRRGHIKSSIIYITYGDVEMLTAEDDVTPILRMTRGTILSSCGGCPEAACAPAYVEIRAATYCTAHVLKASDLWRVTMKHGKSNGQAFIMTSSFAEHFERVKYHYDTKVKEEVKHKSSILHFKRNIMKLKEATDDKGKLLLARTDIFLEIAGCYIMRNRADTSLSDESDAICLRPTFPCILQPSSSLQTVWKSFIAALIFLVCFTHPYHLVFLTKESLEFRFYDLMVTIIFVLDLLVFLSTGANVGEGVPITFAQTSSKQAKSPWFILDVLGTVPIFEFFGDGHFAGMNKLLRLPKAFRVMKEMETKCMEHSNVLRFCSYFILLLIVCFITASGEQVYNCYIREDRHCNVENYTHSPFWGKTPMTDTPEEIDSRLFFSLLWAISMTTFAAHKTSSWDQGDWHNVISATIVLEACVILHVFIQALYSATIMVISTMREEYDASIENVKNFLIRNQIDPMLRHRFITYLQLCWYTDKAYSMTHKKNSILHDLPVHVYQDLVATQRSKYILCIPFMKFLHKEYLKEISSRARLFYTSPNEILLNTGEISNEMFVIKRGSCEVLDPKLKKVVNIISVGQHFGVLECMLRLPTYYTVRAATHVQVFSISRKYLDEAMKIPQIMSAIGFAKRQPEYKNLLQYYEPFVWYTIPPPSPSRERFKLPRKHEPDTDFLQPFNRLGFFSILRYFFPRFTIRPDGKYLFRYEWFRALCALLSSLVYPNYTYLVLQFPWLYYFCLFLDISAYYDIFQRTLVAYFNDLGLLVYHPASTAAHYLKGPFVVDVLACLPLEYFASARSYNYLGRGVKRSAARQFLMLNRVVQLYRVPGAMDILTIYIERRDIMFVIKAVPAFMAFINVLVCFVVFFSVSVYQTSDDGWNIIPLDGSNSWLNFFNGHFRFNMTEAPWNLYVAVHFWVVYEAVSTGFNIFQPSNIELIQVLFIGKLIAAMMITFFAVRVISIRSNVNKALATFQENMKDIAAYMKREKLSKDLQKVVKKYYTNNWNIMGGTDYLSVLKLCDQITLRSDAILHIYGNTFAKCPILYHCDVSLLRIVGRAVHSVYFQEGMPIIRKDDVIEDMYFIDNGFCEVYEDELGNEEEGAPSTRLFRGSVFGNLEAKSTSRCEHTITASSDLHLLQINSVIFYKIIEDFPTVKVLLKRYRPHGEGFIVGNLGESTSMTRSWKEQSRNLTLIKASRKGLMTYLHSNTKFTDIYLIFISMACVYCDIYNAGFTNNSVSLIVVLYILDMLFFMKILLYYALPSMVDEDDVRANLLTARLAYYKGEFKYDIVSCLPIELFSLIDKQEQWKLLSILRLNRMFRVVTVYNCLKKIKRRLNINLVLVTIFSVFIWFTLVVHCATCLWYYIGVWEENRSNGTSWFYDSSGKNVCTNAYICSLYFILTTFTQNGVGDILPRMKLEVVFVAFLQILSTMMYMVYVGEFSNIMQYQSFRSFSFYSKYLELQEYLKNNRVSTNLVVIVNKYCLHLWRESRGLQIPYFLETAPHCLRLNIMSAAYMHHLTSHPIFKDCEPAFLRQLVGCFRLYIYNENLYVAKMSEITDSMYFIHKGHVQEIAEEYDEKTQVFAAGQCFGMLQGLIRDTPFLYSYQTIIHSQILTLRLNDWEPLLMHFPKSRDVIYTTEDGSPDDDKGGKMSKKIVKLQMQMKSGSQITIKRPLTGSSRLSPRVLAFKSNDAGGSKGSASLEDKKERSIELLPSVLKLPSSSKIGSRSQLVQYPDSPKTATGGKTIADRKLELRTPAPTQLSEKTPTSQKINPLIENATAIGQQALTQFKPTTTSRLSENTPLSDLNQPPASMVEQPTMTEVPPKSAPELTPLLESASPTMLTTSTSPMQPMSMTAVPLLSQSTSPTMITTLPPEPVMISASTSPTVIVPPTPVTTTPALSTKSEEVPSTAPMSESIIERTTPKTPPGIILESQKSKSSVISFAIDEPLPKLKPPPSSELKIASTTSLGKGVSAATLTEALMTIREDESPSEILLPLHSESDSKAPVATTSKVAETSPTIPMLFEDDNLPETELKSIKESYPNIARNISNVSTRKSVNISEQFLDADYELDESSDTGPGKEKRLSIIRKVKSSAKKMLDTLSNDEMKNLDGNKLDTLLLAQDEATTAALLKDIERGMQKNKETKLDITDEEYLWPQSIKRKSTKQIPSKITINEDTVSPKVKSSPKIRRRLSQEIEDRLTAEKNLTQTRPSEYSNENKLFEEVLPPMTASKPKTPVENAAKDSKIIDTEKETNEEHTIKTSSTKIIEELTGTISQELLTRLAQTDDKLKMKNESEETIESELIANPINKSLEEFLGQKNVDEYEEEQDTDKQTNRRYVRYQDEADASDRPSLPKDDAQTFATPEDLLVRELTPDETLDSGQDKSLPGPSSAVTNRRKR